MYASQSLKFFIKNKLPIPTDHTFLISGYDFPVLQELQDSLEKLGAEVYTPATLTPSVQVHYCLVTTEGEGLFIPSATHYVTHVFVEHCSEEEVRYLFSNFLFIPITLNSDYPSKRDKWCVLIGLGIMRIICNTT